jgi:hypothetical protein
MLVPKSDFSGTCSASEVLVVEVGLLHARTVAIIMNENIVFFILNVLR